MEGTLGTVMAVTFNYPTPNWDLCNGQLLAIQQNPALYSVMANAFGGDGRTTFALPDLRGRIIVGMGQGAGLPAYNMGQRGGAAAVTLTAANLPVHTHTVPAPVINVSAQKAAQATPALGENTIGAGSVIY